MRNRRISIAILIGALLIVCASEIRADVLTVGNAEAQFQSITSAVAAAKTGDVIQINTGTYVEQLAMDKTLTLEGVGKPVIRGTGSGSVITVLADNCIIKGLVVEHSGGDLQAED